jgi:hypothetical protein
MDGLRCYADDEIDWMAPEYTDCIPLGIDHLSDPNKVTLHPNPATNTLFLNGLPQGTYHYVIMDLLGRMEATGIVQGAAWQQAIDIRVLAAGTHLLKLRGGRPLVFRFVKQ